jgi:DNA-binding CsgD family transcriptional regulator
MATADYLIGRLSKKETAVLHWAAVLYINQLIAYKLARLSWIV